MIFLDLLRAAEQESRLARLDHSEIIVAVPAGDRLKADGLKCLHRRILGLLDPHLKSRDLPVRSDLQGIAEDRRPAKLLHQRLRKLRKRITDNDDLTKLTKLIQELLRTRKRIDLLDGLLDLLQSQSMFLQDPDSPAHQLIIIRLVPRRPLKLRDPAGLRKRDPDLRH